MLWSKGSKNERKKMMPSRELVYGSGHEWLSKVYHEQNDLTQPQCIIFLKQIIYFKISVWKRKKGGKKLKTFFQTQAFFIWNQRFE